MRMRTAFALGAVLAFAPALLPAPVGAAMNGRPRQPALATGTSADGKVAFRLAGDRLTVTFRRPFARRGSGARPYVRVACASDLVGGRLPESIAGLRGGISAHRTLTVRAGVRAVRATLSRDLDGLVNRCAVRWRGRAGSGEAVAAMSLVRGSDPGCVTPPGVRSVAGESEQTLAVMVGVHGSADLVACAKPRGAWRTLDTSWWTRYNYGRSVQAAVAGSRVAWTRQEVSQDHDSTCSIWRVDPAEDGAPSQIPVSPPRTGEGFCGEQLALSADGRVAWVARDWSKTTSPRAERVNSLTSAGTVVTLGIAADPAVRGALRDLTIGTDGATVTWRENGVERSAALP